MKAFSASAQKSPASSLRSVQTLCLQASALSALLAAASLLSGCQTMANQRSNHEGEWVDLFNGKNLDGWNIKIRGYDLNDNFGNTFRVEDGLLKVRYDQYENFGNRYGHIFYEKPFSHYHLVVEYRFVGEQVAGGPGWAYRNNGVMFHSQPPQTMGLNQDFPNSIEFQLLGADQGTERPNGSVCTPGTHVVIDGRLRTEHCISSGGPSHPGEQWVTAELIVHGDELVQHILNGEVVMEYSGTRLTDGAPLTEGFIALQSESHPTDIRSVRIRELPRRAD